MKEQTKKVKIKFINENQSYTILERDSDSKIGDAIDEFSRQKGIDTNTSLFISNGGIINSSNFNESISTFTNHINNDFLSIMIQSVDKNSIKPGTKSDKSKDDNSKKPISVYQKHKSLIITLSIILVGIIVLAVLLFTVILRKTNAKANSIEISNDDCDIGFDLYQGECIIYAFKLTYDIDYDGQKIQLFNPEKIKSLYAIKIEDAVIDPVSEYNFNKIGNNEVFFYLFENYSISLSYMFENILKMTDFSFNNISINYYNITDMKGMLSNCTSLKEISFYPFIGQNVQDISYLFSYCTSLKYVNFSNFNSNSLKNMNNLFFNCHSLLNLYILNANTKDVSNMSSMFYNCYSLESLSLINFNTQNTRDMSRMFYNCHSLKSLNSRYFNTQSVISMDYMFYNCTSLISLDLSNFNTKSVI